MKRLTMPLATRSLLIMGIALTALSSNATDVVPTRPKLVVTISIDQFRADYLQRFRDFYLPAHMNGKVGGFNFLMETGANYIDAHIGHLPTATGPGHASIMTGSTPSLNGIVGNEWFDRTTGKEVYCVDDPNVETVGGTSKPMSPFNLKVTTVGDELKMATNGKSKCVSISFKDRASILLAGHAADTVIWYDNGTGNWVTSTFYASSKRLPAWVDSWNQKRIPDSLAGQSWTPLLPDSAYGIARPIPGAVAGKPVFTHSLDGKTKKDLYKNITLSGQGQQFVFDTVKEAIKDEKLGQGEYPDVLTVNLATNDYIGHVYGPNSPEVMDISIRTDRLLSDLFNTLNKSVPGGLDSVVIVVTADHGVLPIVEEEAATYRLQAERIAENLVQQQVNQALSKAHGQGDYVLAFFEQNLYLNRQLIADKGLSLESVQNEAAKALESTTGIHSAFSAEQIAHGVVPRWDWLNAVSRSYYPRLSGDVMVFTNPGSLVDEGKGTGHGSPWTYDSHIPLLLRGPGIKKGIYGRKVETPDIAPTLSFLLRIEQPSGCMGNVLREAVDR